MRSYFNGGGSTSSATPPPSMSGRARSGQILGAQRSSSASLPRSPENDLQAMMNVGGSSGSAQGSLGSHGSNQEVYVNIYQNTNHPSLFVSETTNFSHFSKFFNMRQKPSICPKIHILKILFFDKIHILKISFLAKFTFVKFQVSFFTKFTFFKIKFWGIVG